MNPVSKSVYILKPHSIEFLWSLTRAECITTKFMRNRVLFTTLAHDILPRLRKEKNRPLRMLFWACSTGAEIYTLKFLIEAGSQDEIVGIDLDAGAIKQAQSATYHPDTWTMFFGEQKTLLTESEVNEFFEPATSETTRTVAAKYRNRVQFLTGDLFSLKPSVPEKSFDLVVCNNLLLHLKDASAEAAFGYLLRYLADGGLLLTSGCNPTVRAAAARRLKLLPLPVKLAEISQNWAGVSGAWHFQQRPAWAWPDLVESDPDYAFKAGEIFQLDPQNPLEIQIEPAPAVSQQNPSPKNIIISGSTFWNPGDDFVREGVIRVLRETLFSDTLNFLFYNFNPDELPHVGQLPHSNLISEGDLEKFRNHVHAIVVVGVSAGHELKPLYRWVLANGLASKVYLISGHYESIYAAEHIVQEPEASIFRQARLLIGRTNKHPDFIRENNLSYHRVNCPALLSVREVKPIQIGKKIERIGFSIQLPKSFGGIVNQSCGDNAYRMAIAKLKELSCQFSVELVTHHKTEYFHFLKQFENTGIPVIFSSFYQDLFSTYRDYDLVITTRLHTSLLANGHGIPGIIINDTDRHKHALEGFNHSPWVNTPEAFESAFNRWLNADLSAVAMELNQFKANLIARYVQLLRPALAEASTILSTDSSALKPAERGPCLKVAADYADNMDGTDIDRLSEFASAIRRLFAEHRPTKLVETGTYPSEGTTRVIADALRQLGISGAQFHSIEINQDHLARTRRSLSLNGLETLVQLHHGVSVPRGLVPSLSEIERSTVGEIEENDLFVDHREHERATLYFKETDFYGVPDDQLGRVLREFGGRPDFVLLDSRGHMGNVEFNYLLSQLEGPCWIALDDVHHIKHRRSLRQMQADPRFEIRVESNEKFGFCIARFTPAKVTVDNTVKRLLWVRTDSIGDAVLASSMLPHLAAKYPAAQISVLCEARVADMYIACPYVTSIIAFDRSLAANEAHRQQIIAEVAQFDPQLILNSVRSRDALSDTLTLAFGAAQHMGIESDLANMSKSECDKAKGLYSRIIPSPGAHKSELERHQDFLTGLDIHVDGLQPKVWTSPEDEALAEEFFATNQLNPKQTIAVFPGAQHDCRVYGGYAAALREINGFDFLVFGAESDEYLANNIIANLPGRVFNLCGRTSLRETAALLRRCRLYVGAESAGAHIACAVGVPNVVVLGGGHFGRFMPYSPLTSAVTIPLDCFGCNWGCRYYRPHCIKDIAPEFLAEAINQTLHTKSRRARLFVYSTASWPGKATLPVWSSPAVWLREFDLDIITLDGPVIPTAVELEVTSTEPVVTAIVSTYNSERFIASCMEDLVAQTIFKKTEILVIDSGSEENERSIVERYQKKFPNIRYVRTEREPLYTAWNRAVKLARGKYVVNANTDDSRRPDAFEILLRGMEAHTDADIAYAHYGITSKPNDPFPPSGLFRDVRHDPYHPAQLLFYCITGCLQFWRKTSLEKIGGFDERLKCVGDYEILLRFMRLGMKPLMIPDKLSCFYTNREGLSLASNTAVQEDVAIKKRYRQEVTASEIYAVDPNDPHEMAKAWICLGNFAARVRVPWEDLPHNLFDFSINCYGQALQFDSTSEAAWHNMAVVALLTNNTDSLIEAFSGEKQNIHTIIANAKNNQKLVNYNLKPKVVGHIYRGL